MPLSFGQQIFVELIKGVFVVIGVIVGGLYANRLLERFRSQQAINTELRRRQYDALGEMMKALAKVETAFDYWHGMVDEKKEREAAAALEEFRNAHRQAWTVVDAASYLLGDTVGNQAIELLNFFAETREGPFKALDDSHYDKLTSLRDPLIALLPALPSKAA